MKKLFITTLISTVAMFILLTVLSLRSIKLVPSDHEAIAGKVVWQRKACIECHTLLGNGGYNAPDLTNVVSRMGTLRLSKFLEERPLIKTGKGKRHIKLNSEEIKSIVSFLSFVNTIEIPNWPPSPIKE